VKVKIDAATSLGAVELTVAALDAQAAFYRDAIGLREIRRDGDTVELGAPGDDTPLVTLVGRPDAPMRPPRTTGLFHLAFLVPTRADLARAMHRVAGAGHRFTGASDHLVSVAIYLDDPEGNGIEIYRDRPRDEWTYVGDQLEMATLPLDLEGVLAGVPAGDTADGMPAGTRIGHVHLQVSAIPAAEAFYVGALGFESTVRRYPGALFVSAGGYHHHLGLNTWAGEGAPAPPAGARGLRSFTIVLPSTAELHRTVAAAREAGAEVTTDDIGRDVVIDPSGNSAVLVAA
jgi:catechol 2,3-dioxygenase